MLVVVDRVVATFVKRTCLEETAVAEKKRFVPLEARFDTPPPRSARATARTMHARGTRVAAWGHRLMDSAIRATLL